MKRLSISDRALRDGQIDGLLALYRQTFWARHRTRRDVIEMLRHTPLIITAWRGGRLVGFARLLTDFVYRAVLYDVIVDEACRGEGIGFQMMKRMQSHPKLKRVESWYLKTPDTHEFYERLGWLRDAECFMELRLPRSAGRAARRSAPSTSATSRSAAPRRSAPRRRRSASGR